MGKIRKHLLNAAVVAVAGTSAAPVLRADLLSYWDFNNSVASTTSGNLGSFNTTGTVEVYNASNFTLSPATAGVFASNSLLDLSNLSGVSGGNGGTPNNNWGTFAGNTTNAFNGDTAGNSLAITGSNNSGKYITFSLPTTGYDDIQVSYAYRATAAGANEDWQYSTNGTTFTDLGTLTLTKDSTFHAISADFTAANSVLANQSLVYLRVILGNLTSAAGNNRFDNVQITGTLIPQTTQLLWTGGNGEWNTTAATWQQSSANDTTWNNGTIGTTTIAAFNTPSAVTIASGGITAAGLNFETGSSGVSLSGPGTLTLANSTITVDGATTATVGAQLSGTAGINLSSSGVGAGTLVLTNASNNFTGNITVAAAVLSVGSDGALGDANNTVTLQSGKLVLTSPITTARTINLASPSTIDTQANAVTLSSPMTGGGLLTKAGTGSLTLSASGSTFTGGLNITAGKVVVNSVDGGGLSGAGSGAISVQDGATLSLENGITIGSAATGATPAPSITLVPGAIGGTLQASNGTITTQAGTQAIGTGAGNVTLAAVNAGDALVIGSALRNGGGGLTSQAVIQVKGAGKVQLTSGAVSSSAAPATPQFSGSWDVQMDQNTGVLSVGPILPGGLGEVLNALGYPAPAVGGTAAYAGPTNPVKIDSGTVAFGADQANAAATSVTLANSFRSPLTLNGGKIASTGLDYSGDGSADGAPVAANLAADITMNANSTSTVLLYDPVAGVGAGGRSLNIMNDPNAALPDGTPVSSNITWGQNSTLIVDPGQSLAATTSASSTVSALNLIRNTGTVTVGTGATLQIKSGASVQLGGAMDALSDGTHNVSVLNNGTLNVTQGAKNIGLLSGTGTTNVSDGVSLTADGAIQGTLAITGTGSLTIRPGGTANGTSMFSTLSIDGSLGAWTANLNINDNKLIIEASAGTKTSILSQTQDQLAFGKTHSAGITTATLPANMGEAVIDNAIVGKTSFGGVAVDANSVLVGPELLGDANIDGHVDLTDLSTVLNNFGSTTSAWTSGNFDGAATIDLTDLSAVLNNFGATNPNASTATGSVAMATPEPTTLALLGAGAVMLASRRRKS
jgi:fibronectin-binding autotransporter adhesin